MRLKQEAYRVALWATARMADRLRYDMTARSFYSPVPVLEELPESLWDRRARLGGVDLRIDASVDYLRTELKPYLDEFPRDWAYSSAYGPGDAELLHAMVRATTPARVIELGSGASTHIIDRARRANEQDGCSFAHTVYDPFPFEGSPHPPVSGLEVRPLRAQDVPLEDFAALEDGDILFVDTTHTVKTGGDVNYVVLDVLPTLAPGVVVHVHDVFLPYEYPRAWVVDERRLWAEQYLLQAFLAFNPTYEVLVPAHALARERREVLAELVPGLQPESAPGALWLRRTAA